MRRAIWGLHRENVALRGELKQLRKRIATLELVRRCVYCGAQAGRGYRTCTAHRDLEQAA